MMYQGLLQATKNSLAAIKKRVCAKGSTGFLYLVKPFFEVDVQLSVPSVRLVPSLDEVDPIEKLRLDRYKALSLIRDCPLHDKAPKRFEMQALHLLRKLDPLIQINARYPTRYTPKFDPLCVLISHRQESVLSS